MVLDGHVERMRLVYCELVSDSTSLDNGLQIRGPFV